MDTLLNPCNQIELPNTTLELPGAQDNERSEEQNRDRARHSHKERRVATARGTAAARAAGVTTGHRVGFRRAHGMWCMFCIDSGIIL
jgi:hypothetical protein